MAELSTNGLDTLISDLEELAKIPDEVILDMLTAEAEVVAEEQKTAFSTAYTKGYSKGITARSVTIGKKLKKNGGGARYLCLPERHSKRR